MLRAAYDRLYLPLLTRLLPFARSSETTMALVDRLAKVRSAEYVLAQLEGAVLFDDHLECLSFATRRALERKGTEDVFLEFGVYRGRTLRRIAALAEPSRVAGFDTFEGLPADWTGHTLRRGYYSTGGRLPRVPAGCALYPGLFADTIPRFLAERPAARAAFVHVDCDLYESTCDVLNLLGERLGPGSVLLFDEHHGYPGWEHGEHLAFHQWATATGRGFRYIAFSVESAAVELL